MNDLTREVYIFDIDGCIMPPIFTNFNKNEPRKKIVKDVIKNGNNVKLYPNFIEFYRKYCKKAELIFFITGRKSSEFGKLTENQLQSLTNIRKYQIIYYPESKKHKIKKYFTWKTKEIEKIIKNTIKSKDFIDCIEEKVKFFIFDDLNDYFPRIKKYESKYKVQIYLGFIDNKNMWNTELK